MTDVSQILKTSKVYFQDPQMYEFMLARGQLLLHHDFLSNARSTNCLILNAQLFGPIFRPQFILGYLSIYLVKKNIDTAHPVSNRKTKLEYSGTKENALIMLLSLKLRCSCKNFPFVQGSIFFFQVP